MVAVVESATSRRWPHSLSDRIAPARINVSLRNVSPCSAGDATAVGNGPLEIRVHHGPGYRHYGQRDGDAGVVLCGGDKGSQ